MTKVLRSGLVAMALTTVNFSPVVSLAQNGPSEAIAARCESENFQDADRAECERRQWAAIEKISPIVTFIHEGQYIVQTLALRQCVEGEKDYYGQNAVAVLECYDRAIAAGCNGNPVCLANGSIEGIERHIANGTRP